MKIVENFNELVAALGLKKGDVIEITGSQHHRDYDLEIDFIPQDQKELEAVMSTASKENLIKMGCAIWTSYKEKEDRTYLKKGEYHYLFPGEWYNHLPQGFEMVNIFGEKEKFVPGESDDDIRFGCLPYGFVRKEIL
tara:strand:+ start:21714 stop:22124 length:411 start_codon:yes stop_codon:yes gene_type:complete